MRPQSTRLLLLVSTFAATSTGHAQQPTAQPSHADGKALVYVYRPVAHGSRAFSGAKLLRYAQVFVNGDYLAELENSNYASTQVAPGTIAFTSWWSFKDTVAPTFESIGTGQGSSGHFFPPALRWPKCVGKPKKPSCSFDAATQPDGDGYGCAKVDWRRVGDGRSEDTEICKRQLITTSEALEKWLDPGAKRRGLIAGLLLPGPLGAAALGGAASIPGGDLSGWLQMCGSKPFPDPSSPEADNIRRDLKNGNPSNDWGRCKSYVAEAYRVLSTKELVRFEAEAGKTYYVKWYVPYKPGTPLPKMVLVDEATGAAEISGLQSVQ